MQAAGGVTMANKKSRDAMLAAELAAAFADTTDALDDFISSLPLTAEQNNGLIELILAHMSAAASNAFYDGCRYAAELND